MGDNDNAYGTRSVQTQMILFFRAGENEDWKLFTIEWKSGHCDTFGE